VVADRLGIALDDVDIVHGDTGRVPFGMGTYGSRSLAVGGSAIVKAIDKVIAKGKKIAAHLLEAAEESIVFEGGQFKVAGTERAKAFAEVSLAAYVPHNYPLETLEPGLNENAFYDPTNFTYPAGSYICEVEVDPATGTVKVERFSAVDDFGNVINPMIVEGQVHGGIAQGLGQALLEHGVYDPHSGQLLTGSYLDYAMPRADDLPAFVVRTAKGHALHAQPAGREGLRRGRGHRLTTGAHQRHLRRAGHQGPADARFPLHRVARRTARSLRWLTTSVPPPPNRPASSWPPTPTRASWPAARACCPRCAWACRRPPSSSTCRT
jgi:carbon-monoxide dehydrogenase large subunit